MERQQQQERSQNGHQQMHLQQTTFSEQQSLSATGPAAEREAAVAVMRVIRGSAARADLKAGRHDAATEVTAAERQEAAAAAAAPARRGEITPRRGDDIVAPEATPTACDLHRTVINDSGIYFNTVSTESTESKMQPAQYFPTANDEAGVHFNGDSAVHAVITVSPRTGARTAATRMQWNGNSSSRKERRRRPAHSVTTSVFFGLLCSLVNTFLYLVSGQVSRLLQQEQLLQRHEMLRTDIPICPSEEDSAATDVASSPSSLAAALFLPFLMHGPRQQRGHRQQQQQQAQQKQQHQAQQKQQQQAPQQQQQEVGTVERSTISRGRQTSSWTSKGVRSAAGRYEQSHHGAAAVPAGACIPAAAAASSNSRTKAVSLHVPFFFSWLAQSFQTAFLFCGIAAVFARSKRKQQQQVSKEQQQLVEGNQSTHAPEWQRLRGQQQTKMHSEDSGQLCQPLLQKWEGKVSKDERYSSSFSQYTSSLCSWWECDPRPSSATATASSQGALAPHRATADTYFSQRASLSPNAVTCSAAVAVASTAGAGSARTAAAETEREGTLDAAKALNSSAAKVKARVDAGVVSEMLSEGSSSQATIAKELQVSEIVGSNSTAVSAEAAAPSVPSFCRLLVLWSLHSTTAREQPPAQALSSSSLLTSVLQQQEEAGQQQWVLQELHDEEEIDSGSLRAAATSERGIISLMQRFVEEELGYASLQRLLRACFLMSLLSLLQAWMWTLAIGKDGMSVGSVTAIFNTNPLFVLLLSAVISTDAASEEVQAHENEETQVLSNQQQQQVVQTPRWRTTQGYHRQDMQSVEERHLPPQQPQHRKQEQVELQQQRFRCQSNEVKQQHEAPQQRQSKRPHHETKWQQVVVTEEQQNEQIVKEELEEEEKNQSSKRFSDSLQQVVAVCLGLIGVALIAYHNEGEPRSRGGVALAMFAAAAAALYEVLYKNWVLDGRSDQPLAFVFLTVGVMGCMTLCCLWGPVLLLHATGLECFPAQPPPLPLMLLLVFVCCCQALHTLLLQLSLLLLPSPLLVALWSLLSLPAAAASDWLAGAGGGVGGSGAAFIAVALLLAAVREWGGGISSSGSTTSTRNSSRGGSLRARNGSNNREGQTEAATGMPRKETDMKSSRRASQSRGVEKQWDIETREAPAGGSSKDGGIGRAEAAAEKKRSAATLFKIGEGQPAKKGSSEAANPSAAAHATAPADAEGQKEGDAATKCTTGSVLATRREAAFGVGEEKRTDAEGKDGGTTAAVADNERDPQQQHTSERQQRREDWQQEGRIDYLQHQRSRPRLRMEVVADVDEVEDISVELQELLCCGYSGGGTATNI